MKYEIWFNYGSNFESPEDDELDALFEGSGVRCARLRVEGCGGGVDSHVRALREGMKYYIWQVYDEWDDSDIGVPAVKEELASPITVMSEIEYYYHNPVYPLERTQAEFDRLYRLLFPSGRVYECYSWSDDWSELFDMGREWFGTGCWSVFDTGSGVYTLFYVTDTD